MFVETYGKAYYLIKILFFKFYIIIHRIIFVLKYYCNTIIQLKTHSRLRELGID